MTKLIFDGITQRTVSTDRLQASILERPGQAGGRTIVFIHGNTSSSLFWQPTMLRLPADIHAVAIDLRGFGDSETKPVDATRGLADFSDDVIAVVRGLGIDSANFVAWSMGGGVLMQLMIDAPELVRSATLMAPVSPYGFGPTRRDGSLVVADAAGSGAGGTNPDFLERMRNRDLSADAPTSPRSVYRSAYVKPGYEDEFEDVWVESMLSSKLEMGNFLGDSVPSENWPGFAPGTQGLHNAMSPLYFNTSGIADIAAKPPVLWIRGTDDAIVSDASFFDVNNLGRLGAIPGWPGEELAPPQLMVTQTRDVLDRYRETGGEVTEVILEDCGHSPQLEKPAEFDAALLAIIR